MTHKDNDYAHRKKTEYENYNEYLLQEHELERESNILQRIYMSVITQAWKDLENLERFCNKEKKSTKSQFSNKLRFEEIIQFWQDGYWKEVFKYCGICYLAPKVENLLGEKLPVILKEFQNEKFHKSGKCRKSSTVQEQL
jgi:hypothetical protein